MCFLHLSRNVLKLKIELGSIDQFLNVKTQISRDSPRFSLVFINFHDSRIQKINDLIVRMDTTHNQVIMLVFTTLSHIYMNRLCANTVGRSRRGYRYKKSGEYTVLCIDTRYENPVI